MMGLAMPASRSLIALLVGTVVFFALWMVALKPSSSNKAGGSSPSQGLGGFQSDINKAHQAVATSNASNAASGNENATSSSGGASTSQPSATQTHTTASSAVKPSTSASANSKTSPTKPSATQTAKQKHQLAANLSTVQAAVKSHKVVALLFYNPQGADDRAVKQELTSVPTHKGQVVKLAIPLAEDGKFTAVTQQVPVNLSPTLVLVSRAGDATEIVGYSDSFEIDQRVDTALSPSGSAASSAACSLLGLSPPSSSAIWLAPMRAASSSERPRTSVTAALPAAVTAPQPNASNPASRT